MFFDGSVERCEQLAQKRGTVRAVQNESLFDIDVIYTNAEGIAQQTQQRSITGSLPGRVHYDTLFLQGDSQLHQVVVTACPAQVPRSEWSFAVSRRTEKRYGIGDALMFLDKLECLVDALAPRFIFFLTLKKSVCCKLCSSTRAWHSSDRNRCIGCPS